MRERDEGGLLKEQSPAEKYGPDFLVQLVRVLRIVAVHELDNQSVLQAGRELKDHVNRLLNDMRTIQLQCAAENVYFNNEFVKLRGGSAFEAAIQAKRLYKRLGINEIAFTAAIDDSGVLELLSRFQTCLRSQTPEDFATSRFPGIMVRSIRAAHGIGIDRRIELARTYAQLVVMLQETREILRAEKLLPGARLRRAVQQLAQAAEGQESLLAGLTRCDNAEGRAAEHSAAVTALMMLMTMRLGVSRGHLMRACLAALCHDLGRDEQGEASKGSARTQAAPEPGGGLFEARRRSAALRTMLQVARCTSSRESTDRACAAYECTLPAGGEEGLIPSMTARLISIACAFDTLTQPAPPIRGLRPDRAMRVLLDASGGHFDKRGTKLFASVLGLYPVGSVVKLSGGQLAVVVQAPRDPAKAARPTVKVFREKNADVDYLLELEDDERGLSIVDCLDARDERVNVTHYLLA